MRTLLYLLFLLLICGYSCQPTPTPFEQFVADTGPAADLWIRDGQLFNGKHNRFRHAGLLVRGDTIAFIGEVDPEVVQARQTIDANNRLVTPGFIDTHAHGDPSHTPDFTNFLAMGVTTICLGQDGNSPDTEDLGNWMEKVQAANPGVNIAMFAGHGTLRQLSGAGYKPEPTPEELRRMETLLRDALDAGCLGLSTGLEYTPGAYAQEAELLALARIVGEKGGLITSHVRNEDDDAIEASLRELLAQGQYCPVQVSHLKVVYGKGEARAEAILALLDSARQALPYPVTADLYPYTASYTGIGIVFPEWAKPPNDYEQVKRERREELLAFLKNKIETRNGPEATLFGTKPYAGKTLAAVAAEQGRPYEEVLLDIGPRGASGAYFVMDEALQARLLADPHVMVCSDGSPTMHHPRGYGSFAKIIGQYVQKEQLLSLPEALRKMTGLPAATLGLADRGRLETGMKADILIFNPEKVRATADFTEPHRRAQGFDYVFVNGKLAWQDGKAAAERNGRVLRKTQR